MGFIRASVDWERADWHEKLLRLGFNASGLDADSIRIE